MRFLAVFLASAWAAPSTLRLPFPKAAGQTLLQCFADAAYRKGFRHLGDHRDFDHGHVLFDPSGRARAILYHTQELGRYEAGEFSTFDASSRNWLQWLDTGVVEKADRYKRTRYPEGSSWRVFELMDLPALETHRTITARMLDPELLGFTIASDVQWAFIRRPCAASLIEVHLKGADPVCLESELPYADFTAPSPGLPTARLQ